MNREATNEDTVSGAGSHVGRDGGLIATFIKRPILATVLSLLVILAGLASLSAIEVRELPEVETPVVTVDANYPGASPETIDAEVTSVLESAVAQVDGVKSISSNSSFGRSRITVEFSSTVDINVASTDMKNAVGAIRGDLPDRLDEPRVIKADADASPIMRLSVTSDSLLPEELADLVSDVILPRLQAVEGVAQADDYGARDRVIRVRIMPTSLAARGFTVDDVARLVASAVRTNPSGRLRNGEQQILIRTEATAATPEAIGSLRLNADTRLSDVAAVEWGLEDITSGSRVDGSNAIGIGIIQQAQSNTVTVAASVRQAVEELRLTLPASVVIKVPVDDSIFITRSINEVVITILLASIIVVAIIFLFLRSPRATLVPALTIPVSLLGTVAALYLAGFSINILTLLALVMATGLVVDDAIVVTENIERWRAKGAGKRAAAILGSREIVFAVISTTATLAAVFIPISFLPGQAGRLFSEFGFTLAFAVLVSSMVALTLVPMLTVKLGKDTHHTQLVDGEIKAGFFARMYGSALELALRVPWLVMIVACVFAAFALFAYRNLPQELTPDEDRGRIFMIVGVQDSADYPYLDSKVLQIENYLNTFVSEDGPGESVLAFLGRGSTSRGFVILRLKDWGERDISQSELEGLLRGTLMQIPGVSAFVRGGNSLGVRGAGQGLQFAVLGDDYVEAAEVAQQLSARLQAHPMFSNVDLNFRPSQPQISVDIDREAAGLLGVPLDQIATTINVMADEYRAADIFVGDDIVEVLMSSGGEPVDDPTDLQNIFVKTGDGVFIPLSSVASIREEAVANSLGREQRRRAVPVTASLNEGVRLGDAIDVMREEAKKILPGSLSVTLLGEARLLEEQSSGTLIVFGFAALIVFLVLAAQFEGLISAFIIMVTVPFGLAAAVFAIQFTGGSLNYYSQIGLVLLIGIMAKNGILIVEFANKLRDQGQSVGDAIRNASRIRFRPVLMTALSTLLGGLPLVLGSGAGAESRAALGWVVIGGLGFSTIFTLFLTPVAFLLLAGFQKPRASEEQKLQAELAKAPL